MQVLIRFVENFNYLNDFDFIFLNLLISVVNVHQNWRSRSFPFTDLAFAFRSRSLAYKRRSERRSSPFIPLESPICSTIWQPLQASKKFKRRQPIRDEFNKGLKNEKKSQPIRGQDCDSWLSDWSPVSNRNKKRTIVHCPAFALAGLPVPFRSRSVLVRQKMRTPFDRTPFLTTLVLGAFCTVPRASS